MEPEPTAKKHDPHLTNHEGNIRHRHRLRHGFRACPSGGCRDRRNNRRLGIQLPALGQTGILLPGGSVLPPASAGLSRWPAPRDRRSGGRTADAAPHIRAVSVDTTASTPCLVDRTCTPLALRPEYADDPDAMFVLWKDHTAQREAEEITALCASSEINYARHSGNHYSAECFWAKCLHLLRGSRRLRRDAYAMVELCDWIPAVLTGADDPSAIRASHCAAGSKQMWAEAWGGFPPEAFFEALDPALLPIVRNISKTNRTCDHAAGTITPAWAQALGTSRGGRSRGGQHRRPCGSRRRRNPLRHGRAQPRHLGLPHGADAFG